MLEKLQIKNLGCFDDGDHIVPFKKMTMVMGPNNAGKSMAFTGLNLLKTFVFHNRINYNNEYFSLNSHKNIVNNHEEKEISIEVTIDGTRYLLQSAGEHNNRFSKDGSPWNQSLLKNDLSKHWYISPNRSLIPFSQQVSDSGMPFQALYPDGRNVIPFLLEKYSEQDPRWELVEEWVKRIVPEISVFKTILQGRTSHSEVTVESIPLRMSTQGSGIQSILTVISSLILSPPGATIVIEEPEVFLHKRSQEMIVNLINHVVQETEKQVIFSSHSWDMLLVILKDLVVKKSRDGGIPTREDLFSLVTFEKSGTEISIEECDLGRKYAEVTAELRELMG